MIVSESAYKDFIITLSESRQELNILAETSILKEYIIQNKIACITANDDKYNKYLMGTPYNIYSNIRDLTEDNTKKYVEKVALVITSVSVRKLLNGLFQFRSPVCNTEIFESISKCYEWINNNKNLIKNEK